MLWSFKRIFIPSPAGRKRFNILGALNCISHEVITVTNDSYINAESVCSLLRKINSLNFKVPISLVLDNARYQKCKIVKELAELLDIELLYLPAYSPNLNLIERLWKFIKKQCLYSRYYSEFERFKRTIEDCINNTQSKHKKELETLLVPKFQSFNKVQVVAL
jgi:transposase